MRALLKQLSDKVHHDYCDPQDMDAPCVFEPTQGVWPGVCQSLAAGYQSRDGCLNLDGPFWDEDVSEGIIEMFRLYHEVLAEQLHLEVLGYKRFMEFDKTHINIFVEPSYDRDTTALMTFGDFIICRVDEPAWRFEFDGSEDLEERLNNDFDQAKSRLEAFLAKYPTGKVVS